MVVGGRVGGMRERERLVCNLNLKIWTAHKLSGRHNLTGSPRVDHSRFPLLSVLYLLLQLDESSYIIIADVGNL